MLYRLRIVYVPQRAARQYYQFLNPHVTFLSYLRGSVLRMTLKRYLLPMLANLVFSLHRFGMFPLTVGIDIEYHGG